MVSLHSVVATACLLVALLLGVWGTGAGIFKKDVGGGYRATYILTIGLFLVEAAIGLVLFFSGHRPRIMLHLLYGAVPLVVLFGAVTYTTDVSRRREALTFGIAALFVFILVLVRTFPTGGAS